MNNYTLSIDPSLKDTGFVLWEKEELHNYNKNGYGGCACKDKCHNENEYKPIWVNNYNFKKFNYNSIYGILDNCSSHCSKYEPFDFNHLDIYIERGTYHSKNGKGAETQEHLRGFICGLFNKWIDSDDMISPTEWWKYYEDNYSELIKKFKLILWDKFHIENNLDKNKTFNEKEFNKWKKYLKKELSKMLVNYFIELYNWNIDIKNNHNIAEALLIGWYGINSK